MKKKITLLLIATVGIVALPACKYNPPTVPSIVQSSLTDSSGNGEDIKGLKEQNFSDAMEAYQFGEQFFNETAKYYETTQYGTAVAMGTPIYSFTKRYKSAATNDFLYEVNNLSAVVAGIDPTFALKSYRKLDAQKVYYARVNGTGVPNGATENPNYSTGSYKGSTANFTGVPILEKANVQDFKRDVTGGNAELLSIYQINSNSLKEIISFERDKDGYAYSFSLSLNENAMIDYKNQIHFFSGQAYSSFNPLNLKHGLQIDFKMDKYGRIIQMNTNENYRVTALGNIKATVNNVTVQYFSYNQNPVIDFIDGEVFKGPTITYHDMHDKEITEFNIDFNSLGGTPCPSIKVFLNSEIGDLPTPTHTDFTFGGWYTMEGGLGERYHPNTIYTLMSNLTLYAHWTLTTDDGIFTLINDGLEFEITKAITTETDHTVPNEFMGKPVTAIGAGAYQANTTITKLKIHNKITRIGESAFQGRTKITEIEFEANSQLVKIGKMAFSGCTYVTTLKIPASVIEIGQQAFQLSSRLVRVEFDEGSQLKLIGNQAFFNCTSASFNTITIPATVEEIGERAFFGIQLNSVVFLEGNNLRVIGEKAFLRNENSATTPSLITSFNLEECKKLETIGNQAFRGMSALATLTIPASVTTIGEGVFAYCGQINLVFQSDAHFIIEEGLIYTSDYTTLIGAISNLLALRPAIRNTVTEIYGYAFYGCTNVQLDRLPIGVTKINDFTFYNCSALKMLDLSNIISIGSYAFQNAGLVFVIIPESVTFIGEYAFNKCASLSMIKLSSSLESIEQFTFQGTAITSIVIPDSVTTIGASAFRDCLSLVSITFSKNLLTIGDSAFRSCKVLDNIVIPASVILIDANAFTSCSELKKLVISRSAIANESITALGGNIFTLTHASLVIYVPDDSIESYKGATYWIAHQAKIFSISEIPTE